jgi:perosamine synthetase
MTIEQDKSKAGVPTFVQTADHTTTRQLDQWRQVGEDEARLVYEMTLRNELSGGTPVVRQFEQAWRDMTGLKHALTTCNGTLAIYSALFGLGVGPGDEVICPTYTWICSVSPALMLGARPVLCDSDANTMQADPEDIRRRITKRTRAIIVVHLWGWVADMDRIMAISRETGVPVIEDCSHAHGATYKGKPVGSIGHVGCWSLQGTKPVSAGEGGVLATNDVGIFDRACLLGQVNRMAGMDLQTSAYQAHQPLGIGMKLRAHPLGIGIALVQLGKLPALNDRRRRYVEEVEAALSEMPGLAPVRTSEGSQRGGLYSFPIHYRPEALGNRPAGDLIRKLQDRGIPATGSTYQLLHRLPLFAKGFDLFTRGRGPLAEGWEGCGEGDFPVADRLHRGLVFLPMLSDPAPGAVAGIIAALRESTRELAQGR